MRQLALQGPLRRWLTRIHRWSGLAVMALLTVAGATGGLLAYGDAIDRLLNPEIRVVSPAGAYAPCRTSSTVSKRGSLTPASRRLHSLNFPWLYNYRPLWDIVVISFMLGGTALCVTSLVLAWQAVGRKLAAAASPRVRHRHAVLSEG